MSTKPVERSKGEDDVRFVSGGVFRAHNAHIANGTKSDFRCRLCRQGPSGIFQAIKSAPEQETQLAQDTGDDETDDASLAHDYFGFSKD